MLVQFCYIAWYMIDQEEFGSANIDDYDFSGDEKNDSQEDDNYFNHSVRRSSNSNSNYNNSSSSWLDTV